MLKQLYRVFNLFAIVIRHNILKSLTIKYATSKIHLSCPLYGFTLYPRHGSESYREQATDCRLLTNGLASMSNKTPENKKAHINMASIDLGFLMFLYTYHPYLLDIQRRQFGNSTANEFAT